MSSGGGLRRESSMASFGETQNLRREESAYGKLGSAPLEARCLDAAREKRERSDGNRIEDNRENEPHEGSDCGDGADTGIPGHGVRWIGRHGQAHVDLAEAGTALSAFQAL